MKPFIKYVPALVFLCVIFCSANNSLYGINTLPVVDEITVTPTEKIGYVNLSLDIESSQDVTVHILDMYEQPYVENFYEKKYDIGNHTHILDLTQLPSGLYTIQVLCGAQKINQKLIVMSE